MCVMIGYPQKSCKTVTYQVVKDIHWPEPIYMRVGYVFDLGFSE